MSSVSDDQDIEQKAIIHLWDQVIGLANQRPGVPCQAEKLVLWCP